MPSYYDPGRFSRKMARSELVRERNQKELEERIKNKPKPILNRVCAEIGKDISKLRKRAGITQTKLGELTNMYQSEIARIESGRHNLTVKKIEKLAKALGKDIKIVIG